MVVVVVAVVVVLVLVLTVTVVVMEVVVVVGVSDAKPLWRKVEGTVAGSSAAWAWLTAPSTADRQPFAERSVVTFKGRSICCRNEDLNDRMVCSTGCRNEVVWGGTVRL